MTYNGICRIFEQSLKKFFLKIDEETLNSDGSDANDMKIKISVCDGKNVWESTKSKIIIVLDSMNIN